MEEKPRELHEGTAVAPCLDQGVRERDFPEDVLGGPLVAWKAMWNKAHSRN